VLVVDDDAQMRRVLVRSLESIGHRCSAAASAAEAHERLAAGSFALLVCDVNLPGESGLELTRHVLAERPSVAALMVSGSESPQFAATAVDYGAYGYLVKPFTATALRIAVMNALRRRELEIRHRAQTERLEDQVRRRTDSLEASREETIRRLSRAVEYRDPFTGAHLDRMSRQCARLAGQLGLDPRQVEIASAMHDVGKIGVPDRILLKRGPLTDEERRAMQEHAQIGHDILAGSESDLLQLAATIAWTHHERYDGDGYPRGLRDQEIPLAGRIAAVADVYDALTSDRPYRTALPAAEAVAMMERERGRHFDPAVLDAFLRLLRQPDPAP
jgi:putative two-component system response regulator